ncbi:sugar-transfer associated ATP-grasp domain-containing protein [Spiribacter halobius]|uniref:Alpha-L-glutamate ligase-related protein ATP-grasp domain-containing protein n=1 Tax=Sediminicurvatus halobius TaxID=2182432 RepID=A0A2U2MXL8_9GAMM|nr:sugar-transfer associated ATP-grasp domain-containing protein [Spiribacter halobius]PWG61691.1 hypothetical protein DEM34_15130 [Spiribacter halobius]UEX77315.1 hypothetical protein LMH63_15405 [Spiribacter halobius]
MTTREEGASRVTTLADGLSCDTLPLWRQYLEMAVLRAWRGVGPRYFRTAGFASRGVPWRVKRDHFGSREYTRWINRMNPPAYRKISQNKLVEKAVLRAMCLPTPRLIGLLDPWTGITPDGDPLTSAEDLGATLRRSPAARICFKTLQGWGGNGFVAARVIRGEGDCRLADLHGDRPLATDVFLKEVGFAEGSPRMVEEYIDQAPHLAALNPTSVNTLRIWALRAGDYCEPRILGAYLRVGRTGSIVDNRERGGLVAPVQLSHGVLGAASDGQGAWVGITHHPDSGERIAGMPLPEIDDCLALAGRALCAFPGIRFAGVDVAVTRSGPTVVELNVNPAKNGAAILGVTRTALRRAFEASKESSIRA